jgi:hypothetical protein
MEMLDILKPGNDTEKPKQAVGVSLALSPAGLLIAS